MVLTGRLPVWLHPATLLPSGPEVTDGVRLYVGWRRSPPLGLALLVLPATRSGGPSEGGRRLVVAVNLFGGRLPHGLADLRWALAVDPAVPLVTFDARDRLSVRDALLAVLRHALDQAETTST